MAECECLKGCIFFNDKMEEKPVTANLMKKNYCLGDNSRCARYQVYKKIGGQGVPPDLFPSQTDRAEAILKA